MESKKQKLYYYNLGVALKMTETVFYTLSIGLIIHIFYSSHPIFLWDILICTGFHSLFVFHLWPLLQNFNEFHVKHLLKFILLESFCREQAHTYSWSLLIFPTTNENNLFQFLRVIPRNIKLLWSTENSIFSPKHSTSNTNSNSYNLLCTCMTGNLMCPI